MASVRALRFAGSMAGVTDPARPQSGLPSLALGCGGILALALGLLLLWLGINAPPPQGLCTVTANGYTCYYAQSPPPDPRIYVGWIGVILSPCLLIAGLRMGNRHSIIKPAQPSGEVAGDGGDPSAPVERAVRWLLAGPSEGKWALDGPSVAKTGLILFVLTVLAGLAIYVWLVVQFGRGLSSGTF